MDDEWVPHWIHSISHAKVYFFAFYLCYKIKSARTTCVILTHLLDSQSARDIGFYTKFDSEDVSFIRQISSQTAHVWAQGEGRQDIIKGNQAIIPFDVTGRQPHFSMDFCVMQLNIQPALEYVWYPGSVWFEQFDLKGEGSRSYWKQRSH